jgi:hypothetical protein
MTETPVTLADIATLSALAQAILPADERDAGAAAVHAGPGIAERMRCSAHGGVYLEGLAAVRKIARRRFALNQAELDAAQWHELVADLREQAPAFFRQIRADVCALYLSDPGVWQRIGFPGPSTETGGYPEFDQPQT